MVIQALLVSNIFILLYNNLLFVLNSKFPSEASTQFIRAGAVPEPFEIPLFLALSFVLGSILFFIQRKLQVKTGSANKTLKISLLIFLALTFIANLGTYPMAHDVYPQPTRDKQFIYFVFFAISMASAAFIIIETYLLSPVLKKSRFLLALVFSAVLFIIALITLDPHFNIYGHDYSYFFGPVWEIVNGKTIYTQTPSQYGFVSILILALLQKLNIMSALYLPVVVWLFYIAEYLMFFIIVYKIAKSIPLALTGLFSLITINYLSLYHLPAQAPQIGPFRWLPLVLSVFLLLKIKKIDSKLFIFLIALLSTWVIDSGIFLLLAYSATLFLLLLNKQIKFRQLFGSLLLLLFFLVSIFSFINLIHFVFNYQMINPILIFSKLKQYGSAGFGMLPMDTKTYFWIVPLIYFTSIIYFLKNSSSKNILSGGRGRRAPDDPTSRSALRGAGSAGGLAFRSFSEGGEWKPLTESDKMHNNLLLFTANLSLFASIYFVGRSHPHNLFHISIFPLLNLFILLSLVFKKRFSLIFYLVTFILLVAFPFYQRQEAITNLLKLKINQYQTSRILTRDWWYGLNFYYQKEIKMIKENMPEDKIVILSADDTYLFYLVGKKNFIYDNSQFTILTEKDMDYSLHDVYKTCPQKIVADCSLFKKCENNRPFTEIAGFNIQPRLLEKIESHCQVKYLPQSCTDKLCLAGH